MLVVDSLENTEIEEKKTTFTFDTKRQTLLSF